MRILKKESDNILVITSPKDEASVGDYLVATEATRGLILQVYGNQGYSGLISLALP